MTSDIATSRQRLRTPRAAAVAGILFAVLFSAAMLMIRMVLPEELSGPPAAGWLRNNTSLNTLALTLVLPPDRWAGALIPLSAALVWALPHWRDRSRTEVRVDHSTTFKEDQNEQRR